MVVGLGVGFDRVRKSLVIATKDGKVALCFALLVASQKRLEAGMQKQSRAAIARVLGLER